MIVAVILSALLGLAGAALYFLAANAKPMPTIGEFLAKLPPSERAALDAVCATAGLEATSLRPVGMIGSEGFRHPLNKRAARLEDGHVRALGISAAKFTQGTPDFSAFPELEVLFLENSTLTAWPDLSKLTKLRELNLNGTTLASPPAGGLPPSVQVLSAARNKIAGLEPLAGLTKLRELDLSDNPAVTDIAPLTSLAIDSINLSKTGMATLPATVPHPGDWKLNLDGTKLTNPPGFSWDGPGSYSYAGNNGMGSQTSKGHTRIEDVDVQGTAEFIPALRPVDMPNGASDASSLGPVVLEAEITKGRVRLWLGEGNGFFQSPWFTNGNVKGFGFIRTAGHAIAEIGPGEISHLRGTLIRSGSQEHGSFFFYVQPIGDEKPEGFRYHVKSAQ